MGTVKKRAIAFNAAFNGRAFRYYRNYDDPSRNWEWLPEYAKSDNTASFAPLQGTQVTESETHSGWTHPRKKGVFKRDAGGPFKSVKKWAESLNASPLNFDNEARYGWLNHEYDWFSYIGPVLPLAPTAYEWPPDVSSTGSQLDVIGTTAISRCSPSNPAADLSVTFGELFKEGIPTLIGGTLKTLRGMTNQQRRKAIGHEYLNVEFGWKPFLQDLANISKAIITADLILNQYNRDSGRLVRRKYEFPTVSRDATRVVADKKSPWISPSIGGLYINSEINKGQVIRTDKVRIRRWFSGAFTYYVPPADSMRNDMARQVIQARKVLGLSLTPDTLWNLAPWSWAVDWFFNAGDVLTNWTDWAIDNQVLAYGYMMEHSVSSYNYTFVGKTGFRPGAIPADVTLTHEVKQRRQATPYGFGLSWNSFSPRQLAIVAALGLSRS